MRCRICKAKTEVKLKTVTIEHRGKSFEFQVVLAEVCPKCGLIMLDDETSKSLHSAAEYQTSPRRQVLARLTLKGRAN